MSNEGNSAGNISAVPVPFDASRVVLIDQGFRTARTLIWVAGAVATAYILRDSILLLAGQTTKLALELSFFGDFKFAASIAFSGGAVIWAVVERKLRHRKVEHLQGRLKQFELKLDPTRTSSQLTTSGKTHPRDKG